MTPVILKPSDALQSRYDEILDEKRNFWGFLFTLISLVLWPVSTYIGYYGMNYDNMKEAWITSGYTVYGVMFFWMMTGESNLSISYFIQAEYNL